MGFSLIELSIVILVIGILVAGVTKGGAIMTKARIGSAESLTSSAPVAAIQNLVAWYEPVLKTSFNDANRFDGTVLTNTNGGSWFDNSPNKNLNTTTVAGTVTYQESGINGLPTVRFAGTTSSLAFDSSILNQKDYTIFVVEQRRVATSATVGSFLSIGGANNLGYSTTTDITMPGSGTKNVSAFVRITPRIITFLSSSNLLATATKGVFVNGGNGNLAANAAVDTKITATSTGFIGRSNTTSFYNGDISEIIIYDRALQLDERNDIQNYLGKKYGINVTISA